MINRVFCYSKEEAKKNKNHVSILKMLFQITGIILLLTFALVVYIIFLNNFMNNPIFSLLITLVFIGFIVYYTLSFNFKFRSQLMGFAIDTENNIYCATKLNNGQEFVIGGIAAGGVIDTVLKDSNSFAGNAAEGIGAAMTLYSLSKSTKIMQNPEVIAKMVEYAETTSGTEVKQILKVHDYTQNSHLVKLRCDYKIMKTGKIKYNKKITIYKSFNNFNDLLELILNKKEY